MGRIFTLTYHSCDNPAFRVGPEIEIHGYEEKGELWLKLADVRKAMKIDSVPIMFQATDVARKGGYPYLSPLGIRRLINAVNSVECAHFARWVLLQQGV